MSRTVPASAPNLALPVDGRVELEYDLTIVTPMVGGSAIAREANTQVRPTEIMGNLRHWWRATNAGRFNLGELVWQEDALFGSAVHPGHCQISVTTVKPGKVRPDLTNDRASSYAIWALLENNKVSHRTQFTDQVTLGTQFTLRLRFTPEWEQAILPAMQAFIAYGGLGGRTRRGCGSLQLSTLTTRRPDGTKDVSDYARPRIRPIGLPTAPAIRDDRMTGLPQHVFVFGRAMTDPVQAWHKSLKAYQDFRREMRQKRSSHPNATVQTGSEGQHRIASPIITKALQWDGGFLPMVAILDAPLNGDPSGQAIENFLNEGGWREAEMGVRP